MPPRQNIKIFFIFYFKVTFLLKAFPFSMPTEFTSNGSIFLCFCLSYAITFYFIYHHQQRWSELYSSLISSSLFPVDSTIHLQQRTNSIPLIRLKNKNAKGQFLFSDLSRMTGKTNTIQVPKSQFTNVHTVTIDGWTISGTYAQETGATAKTKANMYTPKHIKISVMVVEG